jgi:hypothetical protein
LNLKREIDRERETESERYIVRRSGHEVNYKGEESRDPPVSSQDVEECEWEEDQQATEQLNNMHVHLCRGENRE